MSAALAALSCQGGFKAFSETDGDNGHISEHAYDDGLPIFAAGFDDEFEEHDTPPPAVKWCVRWQEVPASAGRDGCYRVQPIGPAGPDDGEPLVDTLPPDPSQPVAVGGQL